MGNLSGFDSQPKEPFLDRTARTIMAVLGCIAVLVLAAASPLFAYAVMDSSDACVADPGPFGCGANLFLVAGALPVAAALVSILVGVPLTFVFTPRPRVRWVALGLVLQVMGFVASYVIMPIW